jgi:hypothetical protein
MKYTITATIRMAEFLEPDIYEVASSLKMGRMEWTTQRGERRVAVVAAFHDLSQSEGKLLLCRLKEISEINGVNVKNIIVAVENQCVSWASRTLRAMPLHKSDQAAAFAQFDSTGHLLH